MWNDLTFDEMTTLVYSIRDKRRVDWDTGEGICWIRLTKEDMKSMKEMYLDWNDCE